MGTIEDIQALSRAINCEAELAEAHPEAYMAGLDLGTEVTNRHLAEVPAFGTAMYDEMIARAAYNIAHEHRQRASETHHFTDLGDIQANGLGLRAGTEHAVRAHRLGVAA